MTNEQLTPVPSTPAGVVRFDYAEFEGTGLENASTKDAGMPFLELLQANSKALQESNPKYLPGGKPGMFLNTATREVIDGVKGVPFVPLFVDHCVVEWKPERAGFVARHPIDSDIFKQAMARFEANKDPKKSMAKDILAENGNQLVETYYVWALLLEEDGVTPRCGAIIPFSSTKIPIYRKGIYTPCYSFKGAGGKLYVHRMRLTTASEPRAKGTSYNYRISSFGKDLASSLIDPTTPLMRFVYQEFVNIRDGKTKMATPEGNDGGADEGVGDGKVDEVFA